MMPKDAAGLIWQLSSMLMSSGIKLSPVSTQEAGWGEGNKCKGSVIPANLGRQTGDATLSSVHKCAKSQLPHFPVSTQPRIDHTHTQKALWRWRQQLEWCGCKPQKATRAVTWSWKRQGTDSPLHPSVGAWLCWQVDFGSVVLGLDLWSPEPWEHKLLLFWVTKFVVCFSCHSKVIQWRKDSTRPTAPSQRPSVY